MLNNEKDLPKPGSKEAIEQGCTCPVLDNAHGKGIGGMGEQFGWWINEDCPIHNTKKTFEEKIKELNVK